MNEHVTTGTDIHGPERIKRADFSDPLTSSTMRFTFVVLCEMSRPQIEALPVHWVQSFMFPSG